MSTKALQGPLPDHAEDRHARGRQIASRGDSLTVLILLPMLAAHMRQEITAKWRASGGHPRIAPNRGSARSLARG
jgi:hypothetical protein